MTFQCLDYYLKYIQIIIPVWAIARDLPGRYQESLQKLGSIKMHLKILKKNNSVTKIKPATDKSPWKKKLLKAHYKRKDVMSI